MVTEKQYTECSICGYRKLCVAKDGKLICTSCEIDPEHWKKLKHAEDQSAQRNVTVKNF